jgi:RNA polymerase sigma-70 factor (ECF subfamily)
MELHKMTKTECGFASDNYYCIEDFLRKARLDANEYYDVVILDYLKAVQNYLNTDLKERFPFEVIAFMYMKRAVNHHYRGLKALKRNSGNGTDSSYEGMEIFIGDSESFSETEFKQAVAEIMEKLTDEQQRIFLEKLEGYTLKEIAKNNGINIRRVYNQFGKIKEVVAVAMNL